MKKIDKKVTIIAARRPARTSSIMTKKAPCFLSNFLIPMGFKMSKILNKTKEITNQKIESFITAKGMHATHIPTNSSQTKLAGSFWPSTVLGYIYKPKRKEKMMNVKKIIKSTNTVIFSKKSM